MQSVTCLATDACLTVVPGSRVRSRPGSKQKYVQEVLVKYWGAARA